MTGLNVAVMIMFLTQSREFCQVRCSVKTATRPDGLMV